MFDGNAGCCSRCSPASPSQGTWHGRFCNDGRRCVIHVCSCSACSSEISARELQNFACGTDVHHEDMYSHGTDPLLFVERNTFEFRLYADVSFVPLGWPSFGGIITQPSGDQFRTMNSMPSAHYYPATSGPVDYDVRLIHSVFFHTLLVGMHAMTKLSFTNYTHCWFYRWHRHRHNRPTRSKISSVGCPTDRTFTSNQRPPSMKRYSLTRQSQTAIVLLMSQLRSRPRRTNQHHSKNTSIDAIMHQRRHERILNSSIL